MNIGTLTYRKVKFVGVPEAGFWYIPRRREHEGVLDNLIRIRQIPMLAGFIVTLGHKYRVVAAGETWEKAADKAIAIYKWQVGHTACGGDCGDE